MRVLVAEHQKTMRKTIRLCLEVAGRVEIVGEAVDIDSALNCAKELLPDVIVIDDHLTPMENGHAAAYCKSQGLSTAVVAIFRKLDAAWIHHSHRLGVYGFLLRSETGEHLAEAVQTVHHGRHYFSPKASEIYYADKE